MKENPISAVYRIGGAALGMIAIILSFVGNVPENVVYEPTEGIAVFAVLYVIAQAVERLVEWVTDGLKLIPVPRKTRRLMDPEIATG